MHLQNASRVPVRLVPRLGFDSLLLPICLMLIVFLRQSISGSVLLHCWEHKAVPGDRVQNARAALRRKEPGGGGGQRLPVAAAQRRGLRRLSHVGDVRR